MPRTVLPDPALQHPSFEGLDDFTNRAYNGYGDPNTARAIFIAWMGIGNRAVDEYLEATNSTHLPKSEIIKKIKLPPKVSAPTPGKKAWDYQHLMGGLSGKAKEAMAKKAARIYTTVQLQTIVKQLKAFQRTYGIPESEQIDVRIHPFPKEPDAKAYPIELTLLMEEHMSRSLISPDGELQWEQRYDCELTYDTYGSKTEGDDLEGQDD